MKKTTNVLFVGVGGQGIILASDILCLAGMYSGLDAKKSEIHGMSQRGGSVFAHVRFGEKIYSPMIPEGEADILVSLEEMETLRWLNYAGKNTKIVLVKNRIMPAQQPEYPEGIEEALEKNYESVITVDPQKLLESFNNLKTLNVALIGLLSNHIELDTNALIKAVKECVPDGTVDLNLLAFDFGKNKL